MLFLNFVKIEIYIYSNNQKDIHYWCDVNIMSASILSIFFQIESVYE